MIQLRDIFILSGYPISILFTKTFAAPFVVQIARTIRTALSSDLFSTLNYCLHIEFALESSDICSCLNRPYGKVKCHLDGCLTWHPDVCFLDLIYPVTHCITLPTVTDIVVLHRR